VANRHQRLSAPRRHSVNNCPKGHSDTRFIQYTSNAGNEILVETLTRELGRNCDMVMKRIRTCRASSRRWKSHILCIFEHRTRHVTILYCNHLLRIESAGLREVVPALTTTCLPVPSSIKSQLKCVCPNTQSFTFLLVQHVSAERSVAKADASGPVACSGSIALDVMQGL